MSTYSYFLFFFFNDTATTEIYTLSLHDALPICRIEDTSHVTALIERLVGQCQALEFPHVGLKKLEGPAEKVEPRAVDRKSTRLNSSHANLVCRLLLEKKKRKTTHRSTYTYHNSI